MASKIIQHPVSVVVFVPLEVEAPEDWGACEFLPTPHGFAPCVTDRERAEVALAAIGTAAIGSESVKMALDLLLQAAREIQDAIPGTDVQGTAWFGGAEFQEM
jgi:hypothetical protein